MGTFSWLAGGGKGEGRTRRRNGAGGCVQVRESRCARTRGTWQEELGGLGAQRNTVAGGRGVCSCPGPQLHVMTVRNQAGGSGDKPEGGAGETAMGAT